MIKGSSTPRFAQIVSWKYTQMPAAMVEEDMRLNHGRKTSRKLIQCLSAAVGEVAMEKEFEWEYELPELDKVVKHIVISRDGTTTPILGQGYRETMCGTISFYSGKEQRQHTIYTACAPEYGKETFDSVLDMEIERVKKRYPCVEYVGLADGAKTNWSYLEPYTSVQVLDFYHATEHLSDVSFALGKTEARRKEWLDQACHDLKHQRKGAANILRELKYYRDHMNTTVPEVLGTTITYFENNKERMKYADYQKQGYPIGSGVTEAACKVVAKQRLNQSGMRWNIYPVQQMLLLRGLVCTNGRWEQFWRHLDHYGV
jgi:quinol monooxygenase YgiN